MGEKRENSIKEERNRYVSVSLFIFFLLFSFPLFPSPQKACFPPSPLLPQSILSHPCVSSLWLFSFRISNLLFSISLKSKVSYALHLLIFLLHRHTGVSVMYAFRAHYRHQYVCIHISISSLSKRTNPRPGPQTMLFSPLLSNAFYSLLYFYYCYKIYTLPSPPLLFLLPLHPFPPL